MASITIRNLDDDVKIRLRDAFGRETLPEKGLGTAIHALFEPMGGVELELPPREPMREAPRFD